MKLAEALVLRADIKRRMEQMKYRLNRNAKVQEGEKPAEDPQMLLSELERLSEEMVTYIQRINRTNCVVELEDGFTLADAIARRDMLAQKQESYRQLAQSATMDQDYRTRSEIKYFSTVNVSQIQETADRLAREHRQLDVRIQEMNWKADLL